MNTVNNHRKNILDKTRTKNMPQALKLALAYGLI